MLATTAHAKQFALVVGGLGGEAEYEQRFRAHADEIAAAVKHADEQTRIVTLTGAKATREAMRAALAEFAAAAAIDDQVSVTLIGHGTFDGEEYRFNVPGPDVTASDLRAWLQAIPSRRQLLVLATSASGGALERLRDDRRIVITATKSGGERNAVRFAEHWAAALRAGEADRDKNEWVTVQEAYDYATRKVADSFKSSASLATEHARIEGRQTDRIALGRLGAAKAMPTDTVLVELFAERLRVETEVETLKARKSDLETDRYYDELEKVLVTLAKTQRQIEARQATLAKERS
jgi:hypothetical protein